MIDLTDFFADDFNEEDEAVIMTETLKRCDNDFAGIEFIFNEVVIVPEAIYKVLVLIRSCDDSEHCGDDYWYEGLVEDLYFLESDGKFYKIIYKPFFYEDYRFLEGWGEREACEYAKKYEMSARCFSHIRFKKDRCENKQLKITDGLLPKPEDWYKDE